MMETQEQNIEIYKANHPYLNNKSLTKNYNYICFMEQTEEICLLALTINIKACKYVYVDTPKISNFYIEYINTHKNEEIRNIIQYIKNKEVIIYAINKYPSLLLCINQPDEETCIKIVKNNFYLLRNILNQTPKMCYEAYKIDKRSIYYMDLGLFFNVEIRKKLIPIS